jgi:AmmeMemoRadiSam system protein A
LDTRLSHFQDKGPALLKLAREAIGHELGLNELSQPMDAWLRETAATFVTITKDEELRGCIGSIEAHRTLLDDLRRNAVAAAFEDPRFPSLEKDEFHDVRVEVSLLSPLQEMTFRDEEDVLRQLKPGVDGLVLSAGFHRGTFLPQVWEKLPAPRDFLTHLKLKAGLSATFWSPDIRLHRYWNLKWKEEG